MIRKITTLILMSLITHIAAANEAGNWFIRPFVGYSFMSDPSANSEGIGGANGPLQVELDNGFNAGTGIGYRFTRNWLLRSHGNIVAMTVRSSLQTARAMTMVTTRPIYSL